MVELAWCVASGYRNSFAVVSALHSSQMVKRSLRAKKKTSDRNRRASADKDCHAWSW